MGATMTAMPKTGSARATAMRVPVVCHDVHGSAFNRVQMRQNASRHGSKTYGRPSIDTGNQFHGYLNDVIGLIVDIEAVLSSAIAKVDVARWLFWLSRVKADACLWRATVRSFVGDQSQFTQHCKRQGR